MGSPKKIASTLGSAALDTFPRDGAPWIRRGAFLSAGLQVPWFDVCGPADRVEEIDAWSNELATRASVRGRS